MKFWLVFLASLLLGAPPAAAKVWGLSRQACEAANPDDVAGEINGVMDSLQQGDVVKIVNADKSIFRTFTLGKRLGAGEMGVVFYLMNTAPPQIVKFQKGGSRARIFMEREIAAMSALQRKGIPSPKLLDWHPAMFVTKEYVDGKTLVETCSAWQTYTPLQKSERMRKLAELLVELKAVRRRFTDIHAGNIMYDEVNRVWKVVDPGFYTFDKPEVARVYEYLQTYAPDFYVGVTSAERYLQQNTCNQVRLNN